MKFLFGTSAAILSFVLFIGCGQESKHDSLLDSSAEKIAGQWAARHGMSSPIYQNFFNNFVNRSNYRLRNISGYSKGTTVRFAAIWDNSYGNAWVARHNMSSQVYQNQFNNWVGQGYRLTDVSGYASGDSPRFAAIWEKKPGPAWKAHHNLTPNQYQSRVSQYKREGYRLVNTSGYNVGKRQYFAAIWEKKPSPAWVARHGMSSSKYQEQFNHWVKKRGYRLVDVTGYYARNGSARYAAIWEKSSGPAWVTHHGMKSQEYQNKFNQYTGQGYTLTHVAGYYADNDFRYVAIWSK